MSNNNLTILTQAHKAIAAKKRTKREQIKEIVFDDQARREFLTGFHKRKLAKADAARKKALEREKQQRLTARREQRSILRQRATENAAQVEKAYGGLLVKDNEDEWTGISSPTGKDKGNQKEEEYEDEEILATVTVVEDFDPNTFIHDTSPTTPAPAPQPSVAEVKSPKPTHTHVTGRPKKKLDVKKIKYETNAARKVARTKQRSRRTEKAELAGGKASRRKAGPAKKKRGSN